jgi:transposase-like protein
MMSDVYLPRRKDVEKKKPESDIKVQTMIMATQYEIECPNCRKYQDGFFGDVRGEQFDCEDCGKPFKVHADADVELK